MTAGWTGGDLAAGDVAWRAWRRLGVEPYDYMFLDSPIPPLLEEFASSVEPIVSKLTRLVLDEAEARLYGEARERVVAASVRGVTHHVLWAVVEAVRGELMRPEPVPFTPPLMGAWIRGRSLPRPAVRRLGPRPEPTWDGLWHAFSGDFRMRSPRVKNDMVGRTRCGVTITLRSEGQDVAIADTAPGVDACRRCQRGEPNPA
jgi:hypothetical protein